MTRSQALYRRLFATLFATFGGGRKKETRKAGASRSGLPSMIGG
jgi:hypothetical protein